MKLLGIVQALCMYTCMTCTSTTRRLNIKEALKSSHTTSSRTGACSQLGNASTQKLAYDVLASCFCNLDAAATRKYASHMIARASSLPLGPSTHVNGKQGSVAAEQRMLEHALLHPISQSRILLACGIATGHERVPPVEMQDLVQAHNLTAAWPARLCISVIKWHNKAKALAPASCRECPNMISPQHIHVLSWEQLLP